MSRTLFWYVFKDLFRVFVLTAIALAGIMSFGGLLRPLTENGLDGRQVGMMLGYLLPAMATYSLPIAALFATTMVYGRLSADNEITACRAGGISFISIATPAFLLGFFVAIVSLLLLCFIVPAFTFKVEQVIYSNLARVVANKIERTHQIPIGKNTVVYAQQAVVPPANPDRPKEQTVVLGGPMFVRFEPVGPVKKGEPPMMVPKRFFTARKATVFITRESEDTVNLTAELEDGAQFPREFAGHAQANVAALGYGPVPIPSQVKEHPKFMNILQLKGMLADPGRSRNVQDAVEALVRAELDRGMRQRFLAALNGPGGKVVYRTATDTYTVTRGSAPARVEENVIVVPSSGAGKREVRFQIGRAGGGQVAMAGEVRLTLVSDPANDRVIVQAELKDAEVGVGAEAAQFGEYKPTDVAVALPADLERIEQRPPEWYLNNPAVPAKDRQDLLQVVVKLINYCKSEMHGRASFAVSCVVLVMVGASLGLLFKSGNFLSAFAVSVVPALISIALIVTGQHTMEGIPAHVTAANNPLHLGMALIWSGNLMVLIIGVVLLAKLQRR
jgi:lipopolysaccharide export LptBFGC system permease protein LptF